MKAAAAAAALRQALSPWMNGSLSGAGEQMRRGSCVPATRSRPRERGCGFLLTALCDSASRSLQRKLAVRFVGSGSSVRRSPLCAPTHEPSRILLLTFQGYFQQENIREISLCAKQGKERWINPPSPPSLSLSLVASALLQKLSVARHMVPFVQKAQ